MRLAHLIGAVWGATLLLLIPLAAAAQVFLDLSTRVAGSGVDEVRDITTDAAGNIYLIGSTDSPELAGVPVSPIGTDIFVAKLDPTGQRVLYLEVFGGDGIEEVWGIEVDSAGRAYVAGATSSTDFPVGTPFESAVDNTDLFVLEIDPNGALTWAVLYGGPNEDGQFNGGLGIHESSGRVYVGSRTNSTGLVGVNAFSDRCPNPPCGFVAGFDPNQPPASSLVYASYLTSPDPNANNEDGGVIDLDVDVNENIYAFGFLNPNSQLVVAGQGFQDASGDVNNNDHFLVKLDPSLSGASQRVYSTFIGGFGDETERGRIAGLDSGVVYVASKTDSDAATFPLLNAFQPTNAGGADGYVAKIDTTIVGAASQLWTSFLGSVRDDEINAIAVDGAGNAWVAALVSGAGSVLFPQVLPLPGTPIPGVDGDAAVAQIASDGSALLFSGTSVAGRSAQQQGIVVQPSGRVLVAGSRDNPEFPLLGGLPLHATGGRHIGLIGLDPTGDLGLVLEASAAPAPAVTGETFAIRYLIRNRGIGAAANGTLTSDFPIGLTASSASANCSLPGTSSTCDFFEDIPRGGDTPVYILASSSGDGSYLLNGSVSSDLPDPSAGDDSDSVSAVTDVSGSLAADLVLADFDVVAPAFVSGGFALDTGEGVLATPNGSEGDTLNLMINDASLPFHIESLLGQGEVAFGLVERNVWTPSAGDGADLFGRDFNAPADRVFAIVDSHGRVELRTAAAGSEGRVVGTGVVPLGRPGLLELSLTPSLAEVRFDGFVVASGDPFTTDFRDAVPANVGDDFVISVGFGTEARGAAVLNVPEPGVAMALGVGWLGLVGFAVGRRERSLQTVRWASRRRL